MKHGFVASVVTAIAMAAAAVACGQKGPLFLPEHNVEVVTRPAVSNSDGNGSTQAPPASAGPSNQVPANGSTAQPTEKRDKGNAQSSAPTAAPTPVPATSTAPQPK